jgi:hypothetical protein
LPRMVLTRQKNPGDRTGGPGGNRHVASDRGGEPGVHVRNEYVGEDLACEIVLKGGQERFDAMVEMFVDEWRHARYHNAVLSSARDEYSAGPRRCGHFTGARTSGKRCERPRTGWPRTTVGRERGRGARRDRALVGGRRRPQ